MGEGYASWKGRDKVAGAVVGGLMGMDELRRFRSLYEANRESRPESEAQLAVRVHAQQKKALEDRIGEAETELAKLRGDHERGAQRLQQYAAKLGAQRDANDKLAAELEAFRRKMEESEFAATIKELQALVARNEMLKRHMTQFEASCKRQAEELRTRVLALRAGGDDDEQQYVSRVEQAHKQSTEKLRQLRALNAKKTRTALLLERKLDEVPTHAELAQYGRMLVELYEQINSKFVETRKYYNSFNALDDTRRFLERELSILKSIQDQYGEAMKSRSNKEAFVNSLQTIVASVEQSHDKTRQKHQDEADQRDLLAQSHVALLEKQRAYAKLTREFLEEASKSQALEQQMAAAQN